MPSSVQGDCLRGALRGIEPPAARPARPLVSLMQVPRCWASMSSRQAAQPWCWPAVSNALSEVRGAQAWRRARALCVVVTSTSVCWGGHPIQALPPCPPRAATPPVAMAAGFLGTNDAACM